MLPELSKEEAANIVRLTKASRRIKMAKMLYLTPHHVFSYQGISDFGYTSVRGVGKSVISVETAIILKRKYGYENVKCFYFRHGFKFKKCKNIYVNINNRNELRI